MNFVLNEIVNFYSHGTKWDDFRSQVQQPMLQLPTVRKFVGPLNDIAEDFMDR